MDVEAYYRDRQRCEQINQLTIELEQLKRYLALLDHYGLNPQEPQSDRKLAMALAREHVPGFRVEVGGVPPKSGRPLKWHPGRLVALWADVQFLLMEGHSKSKRNACRLLAINPNYSKHYGGETSGSLWRRFMEADSASDPVMGLARELLNTRPSLLKDTLGHLAALGSTIPRPRRNRGKASDRVPEASSGVAPVSTERPA